ncbi:MAG: ABC transporter permease [Acidobacteria bacterium]|nr:ABC transporter permease [Acidobacteriota bacterium]
MLRNVLTIFFKEFKEIIRDRKTLIFMLVLPTVAVPLLISLMTEFMLKAEKKAQQETLRYAVFGEDNLPDLADAFAADSSFERVILKDRSEINDAIADERIKFGLIIPEGANDKMTEGTQCQVKLYYNNASVVSRVKKRASELIQNYSEEIRNKRLAGIGVTGILQRDELLNPITIEDIGTADQRELIGERLGGFLPYFFIIFSFLGALYPAIDLGAGEKERGTLETLLLTPVPRLHLVFGKFLVVFTTGVVSSVLSLVGMAGYLYTKGQKVQGVMGEILSSISASDLALVGSMLIPTAAIFAALLLSISIYAKSFKEAQSYATPFNFLCIIPAVAAMIPGVELNWKTAMIPITNVSLAIKELIKGTMDYQLLVVILTSTTILAAGLMIFSTKWFERESVLFRE